MFKKQDILFETCEDSFEGIITQENLKQHISNQIGFANKLLLT